MLLIHKIIFNNFKVYYGKQILDCSIENTNKPVILIGGHTGSGKTSIIEGIKLCLYGNTVVTNKRGVSSYQKLLRAVHNRKAKAEGKNDFGIQVDYKISDIGREDILSISRKWTFKRNKYHEKLQIFRNNQPLEFINKEYWQDYIDELTPPGLGELLFFNSEEFRQIPQFLFNGFISSLNKFLELDIYELLSDDLRKYILYKGKEFDPKLVSIIDRNMEKLRSLRQSLKNITSQLENSISIKEDLVAKRRKIEKELSIRAGKLASKQDELNLLKEDIDNELGTLQSEYINICGEELPFWVAKELVKALVVQLKTEILVKNQRAAQREIEKLGARFFSRLNNRFSKRDIKTINETWNKVLRNTKQKGEILHDISESQSMGIINYLERAISETKTRLNNNRKKFSRLQTDKDKIKIAFWEIQPTGPINMLYKELIKVEKQIALKQNEIDVLTRKQKELRKKISFYIQEVRIGERKIRLKINNDEKIMLAERTIELLQNYNEYLSLKRFNKLKKYFLTTLKKLSVKGDLVKDIVFDPKNQELIFLNGNKEKLSVKDFSAGESEIVTISFLWAVNKASGKKHPIITDSPLNRLDSKHRKKFVENLIKRADFQIILLSTDEEINSISRYAIQNMLQRAHLIKYNNTTKTSTFILGYFK